MSNSGDETLEQNEYELTQEWETMARAWVCSFPEAKAVTLAEVEAWIDSNQGSIPDGIKSMPRSELCQRLISIQNCMRLSDQDKEAGQLDLPHARFQRTDQWMPVYAWLETLNKDEVVKSKEIAEWLNENPKVQEQLCSRHTRYHLMHYIKKCHMKILKRREKKKGLEQQTYKDTSLKVNKTVMMKQPGILPCSSVSNLAKDSDLYLAKRKEAYRKYEILVELDNLLASVFPKRPNESSRET